MVPISKKKKNNQFYTVKVVFNGENSAKTL